MLTKRRSVTSQKTLRVFDRTRKEKLTVVRVVCVVRVVVNY